MPRQNDAIIGAPTWVDLATTSRDRAAAFYGGLFGWDIVFGDEAFGFYGTFSKGDARVAGVMEKSPDMAGMPDAWTVYFGVNDANATAEQAVTAGGQSMMEPVTVGEHGDMGVLTDPTGAIVGIWKPDQHSGFQVAAEASAPVWFELLTRDLDAASGFYRQVFGVDIVDEDMGADGPAYRTIQVNGEPQAGLFDATGVMPDEVPPYWTVYFGVPDIDAAARYIEENGGSIITPIADSPYGKWATVSDPMGAVFVVMQV